MRKGVVKFSMPRARILRSRFLRRSGSMPADEHTALKSLLSSKRNFSALRLKLSGPQTHSSKVLAITARQSFSSAVPSSCNGSIALLNMWSPPEWTFLPAAGCLLDCRWCATNRAKSERNKGCGKTTRNLARIAANTGFLFRVKSYLFGHPHARMTSFGAAQTCFTE